MPIPSTKDLKRLAAACRKAGISHFKSGDIEFTLAPEAYKAPSRASKASQSAIEGNSSEDPNGLLSGSWDGLSEMDQIMWSAPNMDDV